MLHNLGSYEQPIECTASEGEKYNNKDQYRCNRWWTGTGEQFCIRVRNSDEGKGWRLEKCYNPDGSNLVDWRDAVKIFLFFFIVFFIVCFHSVLKHIRSMLVEHWNGRDVQNWAAGKKVPMIIF